MIFIPKKTPPLRYMVLTAWLVTLISVTPQAVIFRVLKHPETDFYQCTTEGYFESLSTETVLVNNVTTLLLPGGLKPKQAADLYHTVFNCQVVSNLMKYFSYLLFIIIIF